MTGRQLLEADEPTLLDQLAVEAAYESRQLQIMAALQVRAMHATMQAADATRIAAEATARTAHWTQVMAIATFVVAAVTLLVGLVD